MFLKTDCGGTSCLFTTLIWQVIEKVHVVYSSWCSWRYKSLLRFGIGWPRFFARVAARIISKEVFLLKQRKWVSHLKICYHYVNLVENARTNFWISSYCTLLFSRKENFKFFEVALSAVLCNGAVGCIMNVWGYQHWNTANTTLVIY